MSGRGAKGETLSPKSVLTRLRGAVYRRAMKTHSTPWRTEVNSTTTFKDRKGHTDFKTREQAGQTVYYDAKNRRTGYIDSQGRTMSQDNRILCWERRPDLIICGNDGKKP